MISDRVLSVIEMDAGSVRWSYVIPSVVSTNIAVSKKYMYFGTEGSGVVVLRKL